ncbi:MAG: citrate transporter [Betaproteobacteria bacterium SG8_40]|nr:MAG: citrate transporter [Betaproteobacteria bacterium SG8_40]
MTDDQLFISVVLVATVAMFFWGRWRHDMVAAGSLLACVLFGLIAPGDAFSGFGHPAVITVACVLVLSKALQISGAVDAMTRHALPGHAGTTLSLAALVGLGALFSSFMNNVGAMALLMPVAIRLAGRLDMPPGRILMPLSFGTILGGMTTMIGTPPNLVVSAFRAQAGPDSFAMFDFTPVGAAVAVAGVLFIVLVGWKLVPRRKHAATERFETGAYLTEVRVSADSKAAGMALRDIETELDEIDAQVVGLVRNDVRLTAPRAGRRVWADDILIIEADVESLSGILSRLGLKLEEAVASGPSKTQDVDQPKPVHQEMPAGSDEDQQPDEAGEKSSSTDEIVLMEFVVRPEAAIAGRSARELQLRARYGLNLLAVSREGTRSRARLRTLRIQPGDLLLMQGPLDVLHEFASDAGCVPLAERELRIPDKRKAAIAAAIMAAAIGGAAFGLLPAAISFALGVLASMALRTIPLRMVYDAIDWPVVILLGALIPVAGAMESTGMANLIAQSLLDNLAQGNAVLGLAIILVASMSLSDLMNNAATAAVMCPIAIGTASALGVNTDTFLMAVAIGASCAFLTPIGHQNNTLILGPGGFRFGDYWRLGLPLEILVAAVSIPLLLIVWPL